jgi:hypothetical protein
MATRIVGKPRIPVWRSLERVPCFDLQDTQVHGADRDELGRGVVILLRQNYLHQPQLPGLVASAAGAAAGAAAGEGAAAG